MIIGSGEHTKDLLTMENAQKVAKYIEENLDVKTEVRPSRKGSMIFIDINGKEANTCLELTFLADRCKEGTLNELCENALKDAETFLGGAEKALRYRKGDETVDFSGYIPPEVIDADDMQLYNSINKEQHRYVEEEEEDRSF